MGAVLEEHWGSGIGTKIVEALARLSEADEAFAPCETRNQRIRKILEDNGFTAVGREYESGDGQRPLMGMLKTPGRVTGRVREALRAKRLVSGYETLASPHIDAWLNPDPNNLQAIQDIFVDKQHSYYEHREAA